MYSVYHFGWIAVSIIAGTLAFVYLKKNRIPLDRALTYACVVCVLSELIKTFSVIKMVPSADGSSMSVYMESGQVPLHLCSIQIIFIFITKFSKNHKLRETLLGFMYPTCVVGAILAIFIPTIFISGVDVTRAFTHPWPYQYFLYHTMLVVLGLYIYACKEVNLQPRHYLSTIGLLGALAFVSLYINSLFAEPTYKDGKLISVDYTTNFFFTYDNPLGITFTEIWHWYLYLAIIITIAVVVIFLFYVPIIIKAKKKEGFK